MTDVVCSSCGRPNPLDFRFCGSCGAPLVRTCPSCGAAVPEGFRFCGSCGAPLEAGGDRPPAVAHVEERKVVTSLFADLAASTEMAARLDPEDLHRVLAPYFDAMAEEVARFGGTVEKFIGDAVVAFFGVPVAHEDDPERAIRAALAMQGRLADLNHDLAERAGGDLAMRIGVNTGEVLANTGAVDEGLVFGEAVNIAARLQSLAEPGSVVIGERTWRDARTAFTFRALGEVMVKGIDRPLRTFEVVEGAPAPVEEGPFRTPFVGREAEMDLLRLLFSRAVRERRPNLATIVGPPGIGKSRLSHELAEALGDGDGDVRVVRGRCLPYGDGLTYWPLAEILKGDADILDSDPPEVILAKARVRLAPRIRGGADGLGETEVLLSSIGVMVPSDPLAGAEVSAAKRMIERAWQRYLESMAARGPVVALIEDIHWADPNLLDLIEAVIARAEGAVLVVCTARPELLERYPSWSGGLTNTTTATLAPLSAGESTALIEHLLDGDAPPEVVAPVLRRSEGNPFFAGELLRMMTEDGTLERREGHWALVRDLPSSLPDTVQGVIASRIDLLTPAEKRAIQDASVIGRIFWQGAVETLGSSRAGIDGLVGKELVLERRTSSIRGERELIFNHILTRDVAYASIPLTRRAEAHASVGRWIEAATEGRADDLAEILAYHFELAGDAERTARYALLAGNRQLRVFAAAQAIDWYGRALDAAGPSDEVLRSRVGLARGRAYEQVGRFAEAKADYDLALASARAAGEAELEARALAAAAHVLWLHDRYDEGDAVLPVALEAARRVGAADVETRLLYTAGTMRFGRGAFDEALPLHEQALLAAERSGDVEGQALAHHGLCETYFFRGPFDLGLEHGRVADRLFTDLGQRPMVAHNAYMVSWFEWFAGDWDAARAVGDASIQGCREVGNRRDESFAHIGSAELYLAAGDLGRALAEIDRSLEIARELELRRAEMIASAVRVNVVSDTLDARVLAADVHRGLELSEELGGRFLRALVLANVGFLATLEGDRDEAGRRFTGSRESAEAMSLDIAWSARVEILAAEHARDVERLEEAAARLAQIGDVPPLTLWGSYAAALAAHLRGDHEAALRAVGPTLTRASVARFERLRWRAARVAWLAATGLGRTDEAASHLEVARAVLEPFAASIPPDLRPAFLARPDVAEVLRVP